MTRKGVAWTRILNRIEKGLSNMGVLIQSNQENFIEVSFSNVLNKKEEWHHE